MRDAFLQFYSQVLDAVRVPSGPTISRNLIPVDLLMCQMVQERYREKVSCHFYNIVTDSSPQAGIDWQLTQFTSMRRTLACHIN